MWRICEAAVQVQQPIMHRVQPPKILPLLYLCRSVRACTLCRACSGPWTPHTVLSMRILKSIRQNWLIFTLLQQKTIIKITKSSITQIFIRSWWLKNLIISKSMYVQRTTFQGLGIGTSRPQGLITDPSLSLHYERGTHYYAA